MKPKKTKKRTIETVCDVVSPFDQVEGNWAGADEWVPIKDIRHHDDVQARFREDPETIDDYAEIFNEGGAFPPVYLIWDDSVSAYWIVDGNHRYLAAQKAGQESIRAIVFRGSMEDAKLFACRANRTNGLHRTRKDKRLAVKRVIDMPQCREWSARKIAEFVGVSNCFVSNILRERADEIAGTDDGMAGEAEMPLSNEQTDEVHDEEIQDEEQELKQVLDVQIDTTRSPEAVAESLWSAAVKHSASSPRDLLAAWISTFAQRLRALAFDDLADGVEPGHPARRGRGA